MTVLLTAKLEKKILLIVFFLFLLLFKLTCKQTPRPPPPPRICVKELCKYVQIWSTTVTFSKYTCRPCYVTQAQLILGQAAIKIIIFSFLWQEGKFRNKDAIAEQNVTILQK